MRRISVQLAHVVGYNVMRALVELPMIVERPISKLRRPTDEQPVIVDGVRMIYRQKQLPVEAVDGAAVTMNAVEDLLPVIQPLQALWIDHRFVCNQSVLSVHDVS